MKDRRFIEHEVHTLLEIKKKLEDSHSQRVQILQKYGIVSSESYKYLLFAQSLYNSITEDVATNIDDAYLQKLAHDFYLEIERLAQECGCSLWSIVAVGPAQDNYTRLLRRIDRRLRHLTRILLRPFITDKRSRIRSIIKFLFKNLDDAHSSLKNTRTIISYYLKNILTHENTRGHRYIHSIN